MNKNILTTALLLLIIFSNACVNDTDKPYEIPNIDERTMAGGGTTAFVTGKSSFETPASNLNATNEAIHIEGDKQFEASFVAAPAPINPGLGVIFNNVSCINCHPTDGRAAFPNDINEFSGFFLRTSIPGFDSHGGPNPVPGFGDQLQNQSVIGYKPELKFTVRYENITVVYGDGTKKTLHKPIYGVTDSYIDFPSNAMLSPRIGPPMYGLGLLEAIPAKDILAREDINDADKDGISGKANFVWDPETKTTVLGRFGWKANTPTVLVQSAGAYRGDMGITNSLFPVESAYGQSNNDKLKDDPELPDEILNQVVLYCRTLAVPAARNLDNAVVARGYKLFDKAGCTACHVERQVTGVFKDIPAISNQVIYPYTDMLLHDMGDDLADGRPDYLANGKEWRTRALWGIGLTYIVNGHTNFLHDGRAKSIEEAILWHGGEALSAKKYFINLSKSDREAILLFLNSI